MINLELIVNVIIAMAIYKLTINGTKAICHYLLKILEK